MALKNRRPAFTLVELLVVILIIAAVSAATLPVVLPALSHRQISESARLVHATIEGARDAAMRANAPRGVRFLADPGFPGSTTAKDVPLAFNRIIPVEEASPYVTGRVSLFDDAHPDASVAPYPGTTSPYPPGVLRVEEARYNRDGLPNERTSWYWNVRVGDRIRIGDAGPSYTVVGPLVVRPPGGNPELYVNVGDQGGPVAWQRPYRTPSKVVQAETEFLYVVNGRDDDSDGYVDEGWDGVDNDGKNGADDLGEWEAETWDARRQGSDMVDIPYRIKRRPAPLSSGSGIVVELPSGVVIDATGWDSSVQERSRLPVDPNTLTVEIMFNPDGTVVPTTLYSSPTSMSHLTAIHLWLAERVDVHAPSAASAAFPRLPMPDGAIPGAATTLRGERRILSVLPRTGNVTTAQVEVFDPKDVNVQYADANAGIRDVR